MSLGKAGHWRECMYCGRSVEIVETKPTEAEMAADPAKRLLGFTHLTMLDTCAECEAKQQAGEELVPKLYQDMYGATTWAEVQEGKDRAVEAFRRGTVLLGWQPCGCLGTEMYCSQNDNLLPTGDDVPYHSRGLLWERRSNSAINEIYFTDLCIQHGRLYKNGVREIARRVCVVKGVEGADVGYPDEEHWDYENGVFRLSRYCWCGEESCEKNYPNFLHKPTGSGVQWCKGFGRCMEFDIKGDWTSIFNECMESFSVEGG